MLLAFLAGVLSTLSPCILPLLPIVLSTAMSEHRLAPAALAAGVAISFTAIDFFVATMGFSMGLDMEVFRSIAATLMIALGGALMLPRLQSQLATASGPVGNWTEERFGRFSTAGLPGQFGVGVLLGAVWTPCAGPTLGAASLLASRGENLGLVAATMLAFGVGTTVPLLILGMLSREALARWRGRMLKAGKSGKIALGAILVAFGVLTLAGYDRTIQTALERQVPDWLTALTTRF
jgi:cytochrome c-type biogenesis protein